MMMGTQPQQGQSLGVNVWLASSLLAEYTRLWRSLNYHRGSRVCNHMIPPARDAWVSNQWGNRSHPRSGGARWKGILPFEHYGKGGRSYIHTHQMVWNRQSGMEMTRDG